VLLVPSGFVSPPLGPMIFEVVIPMLFYRLAPSRERLARALHAFAPEADENVLEITGAVFKYVKLEPEMPRNATREELAGFRAPTLVLAAERDIFFPAAHVIKRARDIIPNLTAAEVIEASPHMVSMSRLGYVNDRIRRFLKEAR
jgi:2-hydroxy-6-oxonona-2,4-dienedioate hydrolase